MMAVLNDLYFGIKSGKYWFITVAITLYVLSFMYLKHVENTEYKDSKQQKESMYLAARMLLASIAAEVLSIMYALMSGIALKVTAVVIGLVVIMAIAWVDKLPIWMEE